MNRGAIYMDPSVPPPSGGEPGTDGLDRFPEPIGNRSEPIGPLEGRGDKTAPLGALEQLTDAQLAAELERELCGMTHRLRAFTHKLAAGQAATSAARGAHLSAHPDATKRRKRRVARAVRLLAEQTRRRTLLTRDTAIERFQLLSEEARAAGDYGSAARNLREACLIAGIYPDARLQVDHSLNLGEVTPEEWARLAELRHVVRQLPASAAVIECHPAVPPAKPDELQAPALSGESTSSPRNGQPS